MLMPPRPAPSLRFGFTLLEALIVLVIIAICFVLLLPSLRTSRSAAHRTKCRNCLKQIGVALHHYHDAYGTFPPAYTEDADGKPLHSWRTLLLPYLDRANLYKQIDLSKPWDDPVNADAFKLQVEEYSCPGVRSNGNLSDTTYLAIITPESVIRPTASRSLKQIPDGAEQTLVIVEVPFDRAVPWMSPQDADPTIAAASAGDKLWHTGGRHGLFADGAIRFLSQDIDPNTFHGLTTAAGGEKVSGY